MKGDTVLSFRVPAELGKKLDEIAKRTERPKTYFVKKALQEYLEDVEDYVDALDRYLRKDAKYMTTEEAKKYLGI